MNHNLEKKNFSKGYSLVELLVYIFVLALVASVLIYSVVATMRYVLDMSVSRAISRGAIISIERITRAAKDAHHVDKAASTLEVHPGTIVFLTNSGGASTTLKFFVQNGGLMMQSGALPAEALLPGGVVVESLIFRSFDSGSAVRVELGLTGTRGNISHTEYFYNSAVIRNFE